MSNRPKKCTFDEWVKHLFDHDADDFDKYHAAINKAYWCDISDGKEVGYITQAFENAKTVFAPFSNSQLNFGLWHLVSHSSETMYKLLDKQVKWTDTERCVRSFFDVFEQLFAARCSSYLSSLDESKKNPLNSICYMWWDVFPFWGKYSGYEKIDDLFFEVMVATLKIDSVPCRESALHGLGHFPSRREDVEAIISQFLEDNPQIRPELREYALLAQFGHIL